MTIVDDGRTCQSQRLDDENNQICVQSHFTRNSLAAGSKFLNKLSTTCVPIGCSKLATNLKQLVKNLY